MEITDGNGNSVANLSGVVQPTVYSPVSGGCVVFDWTSDTSGEGDGFFFKIDCIPASSP